MTLICAKFDEDLINISKVTRHKAKWPHFFGLSGRNATKCADSDRSIYPWMSHLHGLKLFWKLRC